MNRFSFFSALLFACVLNTLSAAPLNDLKSGDTSGGAGEVGNGALVRPNADI